LGVATVADRPIVVRRPPVPLPPRWVQKERADAQSRLRQFVFLSMLLHALAILIFGAPMGGSREGRALWGSLNVVIRGTPKAEAPPMPKAPPALVDRPAPIEPEKVPAIDFPPLLDRAISPAVEPFPPIVVPPPSEIEEVPVQKLPLRPLPQITAPAEMPPIETAPVVRIPKATPEIPAPVLQPVPTPGERTELPALEQAPAIRVPTPTPEIPAPLLQPLPAVRERVELPPVEAAPAIRAPEPTPAIEPRLLQPLPASPGGERVELPAIERAPAITAPRPSVVPDAAAGQGVTPEVKKENVVPDAAPGAAIRNAPRESLFPRENKPPSDYDPTKPSIDPEAIRSRAGELTRQGAGRRALLPFPMPLPPEKKSKLETAIENARKPDCNTAYRDLGLLAVVPLIANEFGDGSCKWR
jgi:hypothetical protein